MRPVRGGQVADRSRCGRGPARHPARRANSPSWGVRTVGARRRGQRRRPASSPRAQGEEAVGVDDHGQRGGRHQPADGGGGLVGAAEPGPDHQRLGPLGVVQHVGVPALGRACGRPTTSSEPRVGRPHRGCPGAPCPAPARMRGPGGQVGGARHARATRRRPTRADFHLWRLRAAARAATRRRRPPRPGRWRPRTTSRPMSATVDPSRPARRPARSSRPGFRAAKVTVRSARTAPVAGLPGEPVDARRDVDRQHGRRAGVGRLVLAPEPGAVGGVDHQVAGGQPVGRLGRVDHGHPDAPPAQPAGRRTARRRRCCPCRPPPPPAGRTCRPACRARPGPRPRPPARPAPRPARAPGGRPPPSPPA